MLKPAITALLLLSHSALLAALEIEGRLKHQDILQTMQAEDHHAWFNRLLLKQQWHPSASSSVLVEGISAYDQSYAGEATSVERNSADIHRLIYTRSFGDNTLMLGRQVWSVGEQRQLGKREGSNVRRRFDGVWLNHSLNEQQTIAFYHGSPVNSAAHALDDRSEIQRSMSGSLFTTDKLLIHVMRFRDSLAQHNETRYSLEAESRMQLYDHQLFVQLVHQFGDEQGRSISAWFVQFNLSHMFGPVTIAVNGSYASGTESNNGESTEQSVHDFNPLFAKAPYYSEAGIFATTNIQHLGLNIDYQITEDWLLHGAIKQLYQVKAMGNIYGPGNNLLIAGERYHSSNLASTADFSIEYLINQKLGLEFVASYVKPSANTQLPTTIFFESMLHYRF